MRDEDIRRLEERLAVATPGPWLTYEGPPAMVWHHDSRVQSFQSGASRSVYAVDDKGGGSDLGTYAKEHDAFLVATLRNEVPEILTYVQVLRSAVREFLAQVDNEENLDPIIDVLRDLTRDE